jgi:hypothetical protein
MGNRLALVCTGNAATSAILPKGSGLTEVRQHEFSKKNSGIKAMHGS